MMFQQEFFFKKKHDNFKRIKFPNSDQNLIRKDLVGNLNSLCVLSLLLTTYFGISAWQEKHDFWVWRKLKRVAFGVRSKVIEYKSCIAVSCTFEPAQNYSFTKLKVNETMIFCFQKFSDQYTVRKIVQVVENCFWNSRLKLRINKNFEITRTIYSNSEKTPQFLKRNTFFTCFCRLLRSNTLEQLEFKLEKLIGISKPTGKVRKIVNLLHHFSFYIDLS